jgi:rod shape determining protein RodA
LETLRRNIRDLDFTTFGVLLLLAVCGTVAVDAASSGPHHIGVPSHIMTKQIGYEVFGWLMMFAATLFDYRLLRRVRWWVYGASILGLLAVFGATPVNGAHSWINLGVTTFQPSELAKVTMILLIAAFMAGVDESEVPDYRLRSVWPIAPMFVVPFALTFKEPALGQALVMLAIVMTMYTVFAKKSHFIVVMFVVVVVVVGFTVLATMFPVQSTDFINNVLVKHHILKSYQSDRITTWLDPNWDTNNTGYNVHMAQITIGSGEVFGQGFLNGIGSKGGWVPNQWTDYIYSAVGEEFGFVGSAVLILLFLVLIYRLIKVARSAGDRFGMYIVIGIIGMFSFQVFENIGMDMYLSPSTGIALPFITYGGTSLVIDYIAVGVALSVGLRRRKMRFDNAL